MRVGASNFLYWSQVFVDCGGGYGSRLVKIVRVLEAVCDALSGGKTRGRGVVSGVLARECSLSRSGRHGEDMDAGNKGSTLCNSCRGQHSERRCVHGDL